VRRAARRSLGLPEDGYVVAFVGRIQPLKAPHVLLKAAAELAATDDALARRLTVAVCGGPSGTGLSRPTELMELAAELGLADRVRFLPPRPPAELAAVYRAADIVGVPSHNESFGLVALEAQACGTPVVAASVGGLRSLVDDGTTGFLVDGRDPAAYAAPVATLLDDPELAAEIGATASMRSRRYSWSTTAARLRRLYGDLVARALVRCD
jgi:D-inositol-3-phosphate glycosyltransferase